MLEEVVSTSVTSAPAPVQPIAELFERNLSIRHVYHEPVRHGDVTVIPVAKVAFGFGAGVGRRGRLRRRGQQVASDETSNAEGRPEPDGQGGGGGARMTPVGALEIGPRGTRFIHYSELPQMLAVLAIGIGAGLLLAGQRPAGLRPAFNNVLKRMRKLRYH
jgi:uncharacterized spore protein YtfJ